MLKSAHRGGDDASRPAPVPPSALKTVRDEPAPIASVAIADETPSLELNDDTSLLMLFEAILGVPAGRIRDHDAQVKVVEAQIRALREELGLPEPVTATAIVATNDDRAASTTSTPAPDETDDVVPPPHDGRRPTWRTLVTALATRRKQYVGMAALAASAGRLW